MAKDVYDLSFKDNSNQPKTWSGFGRFIGGNQEQITRFIQGKGKITEVETDVYELFDTIPKPFSSNTCVRFFVSPPKGKDKIDVQINIYDTLGNLKQALYDENTPYGLHCVKFTGNIPNGVYFIKMEANKGKFKNVKQTIKIGGNATQTSVFSRVLEIAKTQLNVREIKPNSSPEIDMYLASVGLLPGPKSAYCASFVYWCYQKATCDLELENKVYKTGRVYFHWKEAHDNKIDGRLISISEAINNPEIIKPGYIFLHLDSGEGNRTGHTGLVEELNFDSNNNIIGVNTIEGNTEINNQSEGVYRKHRDFNYINKGFIAYNYS